MFDLIKKTMLAGVGLAVMSKEKAEAAAKEIAESAKLSSEKGQEFVDEVVGKSEKMRKDFEEIVAKAVSDALKKADVANRDDLAALNKRVDDLEAK